MDDDTKVLCVQKREGSIWKLKWKLHSNFFCHGQTHISCPINAIIAAHINILILSKYTQQKKESVHSSLALPYSSCIEATHFKICTDVPCSMDKKSTNFVCSRNFIVKKKFHLFVAHYYWIGNYFSISAMPSSCNDHILAYLSQWVNQTPNIRMVVVNYSSS